MSLLQNSTSPSSSCLTDIHRHRPVLKRARTPYSPSEDSKRRRTSPTGAFSRLSLSPTSKRAAAPCDQGQNASCSTSSLTLHPTHSSLARPSCKDARMRAEYSAYEPEPNRIIIESLSDRSNTPSPPLPADEYPTEGPFAVAPEIARQLSALEKDQSHRPTNVFMNTHRFLSSQPDQAPNDQQLVLFRRPRWPLVRPNSHSLTDMPPDSLDDPQIVEIDPSDTDLPIDFPHQPQIVEVDHLDQPLNPPYLYALASAPADLMDID